MLFDKISARENSKNWREALLRDIESLLNNAARSGQLALQDHPFCERSVLNYGLPSLSRQLPINVDALTLALHIQNILTHFEPRIDPRSIQVMPVVEKAQSRVLAVLFDINGWCVIPEHQTSLHLRIALDYSCGTVAIL
jgi:type VI secretion system protein ImpF